MKLSKTLLISVIFLTGIANAYGQIDPGKLPIPNQIIPSSPNAASLGAYGESQINMYTGQPEINVPFYTIQTKGLNIPISLSYNASGVKVEGTASWVGLQWSLNAGGVITRQLMGMPDEWPIGYSTSAARSQMSTFIAGGMSSGPAVDYMHWMNNGQVDAEPDIFYFNYPNGAGKFFYGYDGQIQEAPVKKNKIQWVTLNGRTGWKISNISGHDYYFFDREETANVSTTKAGAQTSTGTTPKSNITFDSSWYLSEIVDRNTLETIYFDYEAFFYTQRSIGSRTKYISYSSCAGPAGSESYNISTVTALRIKKIRFPGGTIDFIKGAAREDLPGDNVLDHIIVKNEKQEIVKSFQLNYHYSITNNSPYGAEYGKRLFLDQVLISNGTEGAYNFTYNTLDLPHRLSYNQDHWGFFNNANNNDLFTPFSHYWNASLNRYVAIEGANKEIDTVYSQAGILKSITYPTGGSTLFTYENNTANSLPADFDMKIGDKVFTLNGDGAGQTTYYEKTFDVNESFAGTGGVFATLSGNFGCATGGLGGGTSFYCPDVKLTYPDGSVMQINQSSYGKTYFLKPGRYTLTADFGFIPDPQTTIMNFRFVMVWSQSFRDNPLTANNVKVGGLRIKQVANFDPNSNQTYTKRYSYAKFNSPNQSSGTIINVPYYQYKLIHDFGPSGACTWRCVSATSNTGLGSTNGNPVGYAEITEYLDQGGLLGKNEYVYISPATVSDFAGRDVPFIPPVNRDFWRGVLKNKRSYSFNNNYQLLKETNNSYGMYNPPASTFGFGIKAVQERIPVAAVEDLAGEFPEFWKWDTYQVPAGWNHLDSTETKTYANGVVATERLVYTQNSGNLLNSKIEKTASNGQIIIETTKYPGDFLNVNAADTLTNAVLNLKTNYFLDKEIEKSTYTKDQFTGTTKLLASSIDVYKENEPWLASKLLLLPSSSIADFAPLNISGNGLLADSRYKQEFSYHEYSAEGNVLSVSKAFAPKKNYIWSYHSKYPIAEISNAAYATVVSVLGGVSAINTIASSDPTDAQVKVWIDQLRNSPLLKDAQITSYTYKPLVGMTSMTDAKGMTTTYEYDAFQRLKAIKDQNGNILKQTDYHYKN
nr:RHS repeat domain-containing protein [uncultured Pedobacter sp.]